MTPRKFLWFLGRPYLYRELVRRTVADVTRSRAARDYVAEERRLGETWAAATALPLEECTAALGIHGELRCVEELHPAEWAYATRAAEACPVRMGGAGHVDLIYHVCLHLKPERVVETGVSMGWSTLVILLALEKLGRGSLRSVDMPYPGRANDAYVGCTLPENLRRQWTLFRGADRDILPKIVREWGEIDLVHYDSDKSPQGRAFAFGMLWPVLRPGGVLISDDVHQNLGFRDFAERVGRRPWVVRKPNGSAAGILIK
jgi:predicted O-methyltransferase YrrM